MRVPLASLIVLCLVGILCAQPVSERVRKQFRSKDYNAAWRSQGPRYPLSSELTVGYGSGHGGSLGWIRFFPGTSGVAVLSIGLDEGWHPYKSKWPPDIVPVEVKSGNLSYQQYRWLLDELRAISTARLRPIPRNSITSSSANFWVSAKLARGEAVMFDLDWAGYYSTMNEIDYVKPDSAVRFARELISRVTLAPHELSADEKSWATAKFVADWKKYRDRDFYWWVRERYVMLIGVVGGEEVVPLLVEIMSADPKARDAYYAVNALTRLLGKDVRSMPVEEMDVELSRQRILNLIGQRPKQ